MAAALACREGELVNLTLAYRPSSGTGEKRVLMPFSTILSISFYRQSYSKYGLDKVITQMQNGKRTFVLNWPEWIFWSFVPIGRSLHDPTFY
ncbi:MAG: TRAP transporter small permease subunit [Ruminococcus sp.]